MSGFGNVMKGGWHPKGKDGGKESWRGDFKGINQVAGWMGKGKTADDSAQSTHVSRPLASLKDPSAFGPPPRNVNYHGGAALPNEITPHRSGLGAPLTTEQVQSARNPTPPPEEEKKAAPPLPYRADRTGLRTDNLPPPPVHRDLNHSPSTQEHHTPKPTPGLPPRLPSRQNTGTPPPPPSYTAATSNPAAKSATPFLNQSAINRLGNAGVSVPGLGIGKANGSNTSSATSKPTTTNSWKSQQGQASAGLTGLQSRFSKLNTTTTNATANTSHDGANHAQGTTAQSPETTSSPPQAPSWKQTQSALTTANSAYKDPSSVSLADAQAAAQTASNAQKSAVAFRDRHQETITAAQTRASQINKRYNMTGRLNKFLEDANNAHDQQAQEAVQTQQQQQQPNQPGQHPYGHQPAQSPAPLQPQPQAQHPNPWAMQTPQAQQPVASPPPQSSTPELQASISRKPPPPPPPKKPASMQAPPPVPLGTRPNFG